MRDEGQVTRLDESALPRIDDLLHDDESCPQCRGAGLVCAEHPWRSWDSGTERDCRCGSEGMPCPRGACGWCWNGVESVWPEGCPPHAPGQHLRGEAFDDVVLEREPTQEEAWRLQILFEASHGDGSLEALVARHEQVGIRVAWMRRRRPA